MESTKDRFYKKLSPPDENGCRKWTGSKTRDGYGRFWMEGKNTTAHRAAYLIEVGPIPDGLDLDHVKARGCRSRLCTTVAHLEPVTSRENNLRGDSPTAQNARKTQCDKGHPFDEANTRIRGAGRRECRTCHRERERERYRAAAAAPKVHS